MDDNAEYLAWEADVLIEEIYEAFRGVSRQGGISWAQTGTIDLYGHDFGEPLYHDRDRTWQALVDDPEWEPHPGVGGHAFLDAIGFRYFLPAAMIRSIHRPYDSQLMHWLTLTEEFREYFLAQWFLIDDRQRETVARFLIYKAAKARALEMEELSIGWREALASAWAEPLPPR